MNLIDQEKNLTTDNLVLEPIQPYHAVHLFNFLQSAELFKFIPQNPPPSIQNLEDRYKRWSKRQPDDKSEIWLNYAVKLKTLDTYIGTVQATIQNLDIVYIAYEIFPQYWRQGLGKEATNCLINFLFDIYNVNQITAHVDTRNLSSVELLKSIGFKYSETIKDADEFKGTKSDEYVYKLLSPNSNFVD